ncbi:MAG: c-type cytochrome [Lentisphaeraceae bacterium]|nr:c-type cytochrome [Lentisphaeraceae bacterium]
MKNIFALCLLFLLSTASAEFGLQLDLEDSKGNKDARSSRIGALFVKAGQPVSPFLEKGKFTAVFSGKLALAERSRVYFSFKGNGIAKLEIAGKVVLEVSGDDLTVKESDRLRLNKGEHDIKLTYNSPEKGDAQIRLLWRGRNFPLEPVSPGALNHTPSELVTAHSTLREGRKLFAGLNCTKCHTAGEIANSGMTELLRDTPNLDNAGNKYSESWLAAWIQNPKSIRHSATMPKLLKHASVADAVKAGDTSAIDLAAYISTMKLADAPSGKIDDSLAKDGGDVFHKLGCVACHTRPDKAADANRTPLINVNWKFKSPAVLAEFLKNPAKHYKWIRMPDFGLSNKEAKSLAAYLTKNSTGKAQTFKKGNAENGKKLYVDLGCASCHTPNSKPLGKSLADLKSEGGCLEGTNANYSLKAEERSALSSFLKSAKASLEKNVPAEFAARQINEVNCTACHKYDGRTSDLGQFHFESQDLKAHEGNHLDQFRPLLTWMGEKIQADYLEKIISGKLDHRPRPWLDMRMPAFKERSVALSEGMAASHGFSTEFEQTKVDPELSKLGKQLTGTHGGFSCIICHDAGPKKALAAFEVKGIDLKYTSERLRPDYYKRWMIDPPRIVPTTKMPKFSNEGTTALSNILDGVGADQFMAIFEFLKQGRKLEEVK